MKRIAVAAVAGLAAVVSCSAPPVSAAARRAQAAGTTQTAPAFKGELKEVSADSATDAWAIGEFLIVHWNGRSWTRLSG